MKDTYKKIIRHGARFAIAVGLIAYVVSQIDFTDLLTTLKESNIATLVGAVVLLAFQPAFGALRWRLLLRIQDIHLKFLEALRLTYIGIFFNNCMPSSIGGDAVKAYYIAKQSHRKAESVVAIFVDRLVGISGLIILGGVAAIFTIRDADKRLAHLIIGVTLVALFGPLLLFYSRRLRKALRVKRLVQRLPFPGFLQKVERAIFVYRYHKAVILLAFGYTWLTQALGILTIWVIGRAVGANAGLHLCFLYMPVVWLVWVLPISVNGLGTADATFLYFFNASVLGVYAGRASEIALATILLFRVVQFIIALPGGVLYALRRTDISTRQMQRELADLTLPEPTDDE